MLNSGPRQICNLTSCAGGRHNMPSPPPLESGDRVTCEVGYLYANFSLPRPLFST